MGRPKINLTGQKFGRLIVLKDTGKRYKDGNIIWLCICNCGNFTEVKSFSLRNRQTQSCGCLQKEIAKIILSFIFPPDEIHCFRKDPKTSLEEISSELIMVLSEYIKLKSEENERVH